MVCTKCGAEFIPHRKRQYRCAECHRAEQRAWYENNRERKLALGKIWSKNNRERALSLTRRYNNSPVTSAVAYRYLEILTIDDGAEYSGVLTALCATCRTRFTPTYAQVNRRVQSLIGARLGESRLYCSDACKSACTVYAARTSPGEEKTEEQRLRYDLRRMVLQRDGYTCQECGASKDIPLVCHHILPAISEPLLTYDADNCVTLCVSCHNDKHHIPGCETWKLRCSE